MPRARSSSAAAAAAASASPTPLNSQQKDGPAARSPLAAAHAEPQNNADANANADDAAARAADPACAPANPNSSSPSSLEDEEEEEEDLDYSQATAAIREAELSRVPLPRDHLSGPHRRRPVISPTDLTGADWCELRTAFRFTAPWLAARDEDEETAEMRRGKEAHREREEAPPPGLTLAQAVALGLRGPEARVSVEPQTRADRVALRLLESASALAELLQFGRAREVWVFGSVPVPSAAAASAGAPHQQWLTGIVDQVERRPKGWAGREAANSAAVARGERVVVAAVAEPQSPDASASAERRRQHRRRRRSGGDQEQEETLVTELKTRGGEGSAPSEAALRGAAMQAGLYRRLLAGLAREAESEAEALLAAAAATLRPGGFLEAQGVRHEDAIAPLSEEVGLLVGECERAVAALLPSLSQLQPASQPRGRRPRRSSQVAAVRSSSPCSVIVLSAESPAAAPISSSSPRRLRPRRSQSAGAPSPQAPTPTTTTKTLADALLALSRLAAAALPPPADHIRVEFVGQGEGRPLLYGAWVDVAGAPGRALARRAGRRLAFLRGLRAPTRHSGDVANDSGCRRCVFRERCAGLVGVKEDGDEEEEDEGAALELF
jgi:hypothetical protein